ncbi:MAG: cyclopropane-fatty-acyl-phospholipid synthase [Gammaproteobacteria bacterium]
MYSSSMLAFDLTEQGLVPDVVIRRGIRHLLKQRLAEIHSSDCETMSQLQHEFVQEMKHGPVALVPEKANEQHYEVPAEFYECVLGPQRKYSSACWPQGCESLAAAEVVALQLTCEHARLDNQQDILELGCGWGSLTLYMAEQYPDSHITAVSNSHSQKAYIQAELEKRKLDNVDIITCDVNELDFADQRFDRVLSVEMFEHMRNWPMLYRRISNWLRPGGLFFKHIFVHRDVPYPFVDNGPSDWMSRHFFTGGMMPSDDLPLMFQDELKFLQRWRWDGTHYEKTANAWLDNMDQHKHQVMALFADVYGIENVQTWWVRWRLFFMACAELFGYDRGQQWWVSHYLFEKPALTQ